MDAAEISPPIGFPPRGLAFTILLSIGLHLLLLWQPSNWLQAERDNLTPSSLPRLLSITLAPAVNNQERSSPQAASIEPAQEPNPEQRPQAEKQPGEANQATPSNSVSDVGIRERKVTAAQIRQSATAIVNEITEDNREAEDVRSDSVAEILGRALNKPRKTPGVYTQADGTTRVVTRQGFSYCIKALEDWRTIDPEDDMRVSVYC
ncbi:MAG: hypothetical protein B6D72_01660 [gamma proteobacterium symbiont of Ctena orbiculata]|uniref:Uncharacterized protein n=1 Tax=Candidatus Thiodiazotropha taylori TaxID=2792791 RepID=A0A944QTK5_9GAMM|nr:hypothetical protein [Candidatus Thiodiazotropha taylori]PVV15816.1 MAG: hypothetical protein B6D72_01660 [gamma proteobacterium symbiont of Ctena orbiculata]MBT3025667.1 hypothetical protein [Candidatus Thiodiazotropha taylori]MBT3033860.1 hypothetical protein [Candidatus Thiodiazotropha taylori]MBV2135471.1 hypothetical protein [Candidatus Thiodiazotropha taylori]